MGERHTGPTRPRDLAVAVALSAALIAAVCRVWMERVPLTRDARAKSRAEERDN